MAAMVIPVVFVVAWRLLLVREFAESRVYQGQD
jgi:hypothetical protein